MRKLILALVLGVSTAHAQNADVTAQIKIIEQQPSDMDRAAWKDKRREAARKLIQSKDKKAVPVLIKLADTETFDIIGEIAIEGLGNLGDASAVPTLQKIANDVARDKAQRELAKKALAKLGTKATAPPPAPSPAPTPSPPPTATAPTPSPPPTEPTGLETPTTTTTTPSTLGGDRPATAAPALPAVSDDTLAAYERLTFVGGMATFGYDTLRKRLVFDIDASGTFEKRIEREKMAWGFDIDADVVAGVLNPDGPASSRAAQVHVSGTGEARFYSGKIYGVGKGAVGVQMTYLSVVEADSDALKDTRTLADLQIALGGGYGRLLDVGGAIRVRRLSRTLDAARALGKPIDAATAKRLQLTWWSLRGERSAYPALVATVAILRDAGILLGEPDAGLTYEIINVLRDSQLFLRPSGLDVQVTVSEGYLVRPEDPMLGGDVSGQEGRVEQLLAQAGYGSQLQDDKLEISGNAYGRYRLFAPDDQPSPYALGALVRMRRFTYGEHGDPYGMLDLSGAAQLSQLGRDTDGNGSADSKLALGVIGELGFTWWLNQASGVRLAANLRADGGELFVGASLSATYGLLDATFSGL